MQNSPYLKVTKIKWRNIVAALICIILTGLILFSMSLIMNKELNTRTDKIICVVVFTLLAAALVFSIGFLLNAIRNIFAGTILKLTDSGLKIPKEDIIPFSSIEKAEIDEQINLCVIKKDGQTIKIKQKDMNIPSYTVACAINIRIDKI